MCNFILKRQTKQDLLNNYKNKIDLVGEMAEWLIPKGARLESV